MENNSRKFRKYLGIDVGKYTHYVSQMDERGKILIKGLKVNNNREDFEQLDKLLTKEKEALLIGFEPTGHYWKSLHNFLKERGYNLGMVNSYHVKLHKEVIDNSRRKTDTKDSIIISELLRIGRYFKCLRIEGVYLDLRKITVAREKMVKELIRAKIRLRTVLDEHLPEYEKCFCDIAGATSAGLLEKYGLNGLRNNQGNKIEADILRLSRGKINRSRAEEIAQRLGNTVGNKDGLVGAEIEVKLWLSQIKMWKQYVKEINRQLKSLLKQTEEARWMLSMKGVGSITASIILGQTGSFRNYSNYKKIEKLAGFDLVEDSSGKRIGRKVLSKRGRDLLRYGFYRIGIVAIAKNTEIRALYQKKLRQGKKKMVALISVMIKILRIIFSLIKNQQEYDGRKLMMAAARS